jgi:hypothetical protein
MNESIIVSKDVDARKMPSPTRSSDESIHRAQTYPSGSLDLSGLL